MDRTNPRSLLSAGAVTQGSTELIVRSQSPHTFVYAYLKSTLPLVAAQSQQISSRLAETFKFSAT
jgi:hypothetical protein